MTRRAKGWLAVIVLALVLGSFVAAFVTNGTARARYYHWRSGSSDRKTRLAARAKLVEIGRPEIDNVYLDLVTGEVRDRLAELPASERVVFVGCCETGASLTPGASTSGAIRFFVERSFAKPCSRYMGVGVPPKWPDPVAESLVAKPTSALRMLVVGHPLKQTDLIEALLIVRLAADDPLASALVEETRARVEGAK